MFKVMVTHSYRTGRFKKLSSVNCVWEERMWIWNTICQYLMELGLSMLSAQYLESWFLPRETVTQLRGASYEILRAWKQRWTDDSMQRTETEKSIQSTPRTVKERERRREGKEERARMGQDIAEKKTPGLVMNDFLNVSCSYLFILLLVTLGV